MIDETSYLSEQRRIVAKVEQRIALADALETQFAASRDIAAWLPMFSRSGLSSRWAMTAVGKGDWERRPLAVVDGG